MRTQTLPILMIGFMLASVAFTAPLFAQSSSSNYSVDETFIGPGGQNDAGSASFSANASLGDTGIGNSNSANFQAYGGFTTTDEEYLEVEVSGGSFDMGELTDTATGTAVASFRVRNYVAHGYTVQLVGSSPSSGGYTLSTMSSRAAASQGTEQFGVNLRDNTTPNIGADTTQSPDSSFGFGAPTADYSVVDEFKYVSGESIAESASSSGQTNYTLSMMANVSATTPAGRYTGELFIVVCSTF